MYQEAHVGLVGCSQYVDSMYYRSKLHCPIIVSIVCFRIYARGLLKRYIFKLAGSLIQKAV